MANYRQIHVKIWRDSYFFSLSPEEKLLFIYLFSNESTSVAGIYELPFPIMCMESGVSQETAGKALAKFAEDEKIFYQDGVVYVRNLQKYNANSSIKVQKRIESDVDAIPDGHPLKKQYLIDQGQIPYPENEIPYPESEPEQEQEHNSSSSSNNEQSDDNHDSQSENDDTRDSSAGAVFTAWQNSVGMLTQTQSELLGDMIDTHGAGNVENAIIEAAKSTTSFSPSYVEAILKRWARGGNRNKASPKPQKAEDGSIVLPAGGGGNGHR